MRKDDRVDWINNIKGMFNRKDNKSKAFTLIEIIIVIAIIGVLVMLGVPKFKGYVEDAKLTQIKGDIRTVESIILADRTDKTVSDKDVDGSLADITLDKDGLILKNSKNLSGDNISNKEDFKQIKKHFIKNNTSIKKNSDRFYFNKSTNEIGFLYKDNISDEKVYLATNKDFEFIKGDWTEIHSYYVEGKGIGYFHYIGKEKTIKIPNEIQNHEMTSYYKMFKDTNVEKVISTNNKINNMQSMFQGVKATNLDLSKLNTSNVTNMYAMFQDAIVKKLVSNNSFDTSKVENMAYMFKDSFIEDLNLSSLKTSSVTDMSYMFSGSNTEDINLSSFDTSNVKNMHHMFNNSSAINIKFGKNFKTNNVVNMEGMFGYANVKTLNLSLFDTSAVKNMSSMFINSNLTNLDLSSFNTEDVTNMDSMFSGANKLQSLKLNSFKTQNVTNMRFMFKDTVKLNTLDVSSFNTLSVKSMEGMFLNSNAQITFSDSFKTVEVINMRDMFKDSKATILDLSSFDLSKVTTLNMSYMFSGSSVTEGYAATQEDANKFNNHLTSSPINFIVKQ